MSKLWLDVETLGLNGPMMRIQYAVDDGPIRFIDYPDFSGSGELLDLLVWPDTTLIAYNAAFDVYHLYRHFGTDRPFACRVLDLQIPAMLSGPFKAFAFSKSKSRAVARVRRIPRVAASLVRDRVLAVLRPHVPACFAINVGVHAVAGKTNLVTLSFSVDGRATLKAHAEHYGAPTIKLAEVWPLIPKELEKPWCRHFERSTYEPYLEKATQILQDRESVFHVYCRLDILFLRLLYEHLGQPGVDHHSDCVHAVAYTRARGFTVDTELLKRTEKYYDERAKASENSLSGCDLKSSKQRIELLRSVDPLVASSARKVLEVLAESDRPSRELARSMLDFGKYHQRSLQVKKVIEAGRAYPSLRVMGTATGRMSGSDGLNWQGIAMVEKGLGIRAALECGCGGDFDALEVTIAASAYNDAQLQADLDSGVDFHAMTASMLDESRQQGWGYDYIVKHKNGICKNVRNKGKRLNFSVIYGAQKTKVAEVIGCSEAEAQQFLDRFFGRYQGIGSYRKQMEKRFCTADTTGWKRESVERMATEVTDLLGFTRSFAFEKNVAVALWNLGCDGVRTGMEGQVVRTAEKGAQEIDNAIKSALLGSAIAIQAAVCRQACNSPVQSTGANLTKILMARLWRRFGVPILNIHDELILGSNLTSEITRTTKEFLEEYRHKVKSLNIEMKEINRWSEK